MKAEITYICGHADDVDVYGKGRERERRIAFLETRLCPDCQSARLRSEAKELGLPELEGSAKQIKWAMELRSRKAREIDAAVPELIADLQCADDVLAVQYIEDAAAELKGQVQASWWIDSRYSDAGYLLTDVVTRMHQNTASAAPSMAEELADAEDAILWPAGSVNPAVLEIGIEDGMVVVRSGFTDALAAIMREEGLRWSQATEQWVLPRFRVESAVDGAAQIGNTLLRAGFPVMIDNADARVMAVNATFEPTKDAWVDRIDDRKLELHFRKNKPEIYKAAKLIPGFEYRGGCCIVPVSSAAEIREFAAIMDFSISDAAEKALQKFEQSVRIVIPAAPESGAAKLDGALSRILESDRAVLDDLKDE